MKLMTFQSEQGLKVGIKTDRGIVEVPQSMEQIFSDADGSLREISSFVEGVLASGNENDFKKEEALKFGPCVPNPRKIICVGLNYRKHAEESKMPIPEYPVLFNKFDNTIAAHGDVIFLPDNSSQIDYEVELGIVIGKKTKKVSKDRALDHVIGYCAVNDLSARDLQMRTSQWLLGKSCDGFSPVGPYLVTSDEVGNPNQLSIRTYVNGEIRQDSNTADMIFYCDEIVSYISQYMTLEPGDLILTGTPEGVILGYPAEKQVWLKDGDVVDIVIEKLGTLTNQMKAE